MSQSPTATSPLIKASSSNTFSSSSFSNAFFGQPNPQPHSSPPSISIKLLRLTPPQLVSQLPLPSPSSFTTTDPSSIASLSSSSPATTTLPTTTTNTITTPLSSSSTTPLPSSFVPLCSLPSYISSSPNESQPPASSSTASTDSTHSTSSILTSSTFTSIPSFTPVDPNAILPLGFGNIYLGESLSFVLVLSNTSSSSSSSSLVAAVPLVGLFTLTIELQTTSHKQLLFQTTIDQLDPIPNGYQCILHQEMMELGTHILILQVQSTTLLTPLRKFYKFQVLNPFHLKMKKHLRWTPSPCLALEFSLQNLTHQSILLSPLQFVPTHSEIMAFHTTSSSSFASSSLSPLFDSFLHPKDVRQYFFLVTGPFLSFMSNSSNATKPSVSMEVGSIQFSWTGPQGPGRLITPFLTCPILPSMDLYLSVMLHPSKVHVHTLFDLTFQLTNHTSLTLSLEAQWKPSSSSSSSSLNSSFSSSSPSALVPSFHILGSSPLSLGVLPPSQSISFPLKSIAMISGLHSFPKLSLRDLHTQIIRELDPGIQILVI